MKKIVNELQGKKTYIVAAALVVYAVAGVYTGQLTQDAAITLVLNGLGLGALRAGISKV
jgi:hypothetical protein